MVLSKPKCPHYGPWLSQMHPMLTGTLTRPLGNIASVLEPRDKQSLSTSKVLGIRTDVPISSEEASP